MTSDRDVSLRDIGWRDLPFLVRSGLDRERAGVQYPASEYRKQFRIAPGRGLNRSTRRWSNLVWVDGRRAGYVGLNPLSTNIEYYLLPWARGGVGGRVVEAYLRLRLPFDVDKHAFMMAGNDRSVRTFRQALHRLGLRDGDGYQYFTYDGGCGFRIRAGTRPTG